MTMRADKQYILKKEDFFDLLESVAAKMPTYGPTEHRGFIIFKKFESISDLQLDYISYFAMTAPRKFIFHPSETVLDFETNGDSKIEDRTAAEDQIIFGVHSCDIHAINVLDRTFLHSDYIDEGYSMRREKTLIIGLNCTKVGPTCFCKSMGTGPFYKEEGGCDIVLTDLIDSYLARVLTSRGKNLIGEIISREAWEQDFVQYDEQERKCVESFEKYLDTEGLPELLAQTLDHPVYKRIAESRCLNCANCVMVCPTCFCYDLRDLTSIDLKTVNRVRSWDACHELHFAEVHGGNFRKTREARLRQWVTHKLCTWVEQFGTFGCIGCGRCMTWCPTNIDLALMAQEIQGVVDTA